jgi:5-formyltetrahydrofolate cyclo-ligase
VPEQPSPLPDTVQQVKRALRAQVRARLSQLGETARAAASAQARTRLAAQPLWQAARTVLFFAPLPDELDVWPLLAEALAAGKHVALPRFSPLSQQYEACAILDPAVDLEPGRFGVREPLPRCARLPETPLDLILVPGVAFDRRGGRLGRGRGYYDRILATVRGRTCAVAFDEQIVEVIPREAHDVEMDCLLTPTQWVQLKP